MANNHVLYELDFGDGTFYIGISRNWRRRLKDHKAKWRCEFKWRFLFEGLSRKDVLAAEKQWVAYYPTIGKPLRNINEGGRASRPILESTRRKMSEKMKGRAKPEGFGDRISRAQKGRPRDWSPFGAATVAQTQFKPGHKAPPEVEAKRLQGAKDQWKDIPAEQRSRMAAERGQRVWENRTAEDRKAYGEKMRARNLAVIPAEKRSRMASHAAKAAVAADPEAFSKRASSQVKTFWANLTPEARKQYLDRRTAKIIEAKARKKAERAAMRASGTMFP